MRGEVHKGGPAEYAMGWQREYVRGDRTGTLWCGIFSIHVGVFAHPQLASYPYGNKHLYVQA